MIIAVAKGFAKVIRVAASIQSVIKSLRWGASR